MRWIPIFTLIGIVLWNPPGISAKVARFTDQEGTLHISNEAPPEPGKPGGVQAPAHTRDAAAAAVSTTHKSAGPSASGNTAGAPGNAWPPGPATGPGERRRGSRRPSRSSRTGAAGMMFPVSLSRRPDSKDRDLWIFILPV